MCVQRHFHLLHHLWWSLEAHSVAAAISVHEEEEGGLLLHQITLWFCATLLKCCGGGHHRGDRRSCQELRIRWSNVNQHKERLMGMTSAAHLYVSVCSQCSSFTAQPRSCVHRRRGADSCFSIWQHVRRTGGGEVTFYHLLQLNINNGYKHDEILWQIYKHESDQRPTFLLIHEISIKFI